MFYLFKTIRRTKGTLAVATVDNIEEYKATLYLIMLLLCDYYHV